MSKWEGTMDFEKYYGDREYKDKQLTIEKIEFSSKQKQKMLREITKYIIDKKFTLYHDLMDDISKSHIDWFNMLTFNRKENNFIVQYIKSKNMSKYR